jgi:hypothetical protein
MRERLTDNIERLKSAGIRREIPEDFKYNSKKLKHLKHILHNVTVALGTLTSSLNEFSKLKGPDVSPDGLLGGIGYIIPLKEIKETINSSIRGLSDIADCLADELTNPRWNAKEDKEVVELIKDKEEVQEDFEEINPNDQITVEELEEDIDNKETVDKEATTILASAVKKSLVNFFETA